MSVTDLFLAELTPVANGQVSKDLGSKYENLIRGLSHIKIKVRMPSHIRSTSSLTSCKRFGHRKHLKRGQSSWNCCRNHMPTRTGTSKLLLQRR